MKRKLISVVVLVCLLLAAAGVFFLTTERGLRTLVSAYLPGDFEIGAVHGRVIGPVRLTDVVLNEPGLTVRAKQVELDWDLVACFFGPAQLKSFEVDGLEIELDPADMAPRGKGPRGLSFSITDAAVRGLLVKMGELEWSADELHLGMRAQDDRFEITRLALEADDLMLSGVGWIDSAAPHVVDLELGWEWATPDLPDAAGTARITGAIDSLTIDLASSAPVVWSANGEVFDVVRQPRWHLTADVPNFNPATINVEWSAAPVGGRIEITGSGNRVDMEGSLRLPEWTPRAITLHGSVQPGGDGLDIESFEVGIEDTAKWVRVEGRVYWAPSLEVDLAGDWEALSWTMPRVVEIRSPGGRFEVAGNLEEYAGTLAGRLRGPGVGEDPIEGDLKAVFSGGPSSAEISDLEVKVGRGRAVGAASVDWRVQPTFVVDLHGEGFDPALLRTDLHGAVDFDLKTESALTLNGLRGRVVFESLAGVVNGYPIAGRAGVETAEGGGVSTDIDLRVGDGNLFALGSVGSELDLKWVLETPDLSTFVPGATGELHSSGRLTGRRAEPRVEASARGIDLGWGEVRVGAIDSEIHFDVATGELGETRAKIENLHWNSKTLEHLSFSVLGSIANHEIAADLRALDGGARVLAVGGYGEQRWNGTIASLVGESGSAGRWELEAPVSVAVTGDGLSGERACFAHPSARICAVGDWSRVDPWRVEAALEGVEISSLAPVLPEDFEYAGRLSVEGEIRGERDLPILGQASVNVRDVTLTPTGQDEAIVSLNLGTARLTAERDLFVGDLRLDLTPQGRLEAHVQAGREGSDSPIDGSIRGSLSGLDFLTLLFPGLLDITGELVMDLDLCGTVAAPSYAGQISLVDGTAEVVATGITLNNLGVDLDGDAREVNVVGGAGSGEGYVTLTGSANWSEGEPQGSFELDGERFRFVDRPDVHVDASPNLELVISGRDLELTGEVVIDSASIERVDLGRAMSTSPDEVIIGEAPAELDRWLVSSRIAVTLGDDVAIDAYGFKGNLQGSLEIVDVPGEPAVGTGEFAIREGVYKAFGRSLDIERGRLAFDGGPIKRPVLDVRAVRRFETLTAGVKARGSLTAPEITVFSDPPRPRQYALAMLVMGSVPVELGRPSDTLAYGSPSEQLDQSFGFGGGGGGLPSDLSTYLSPDFYLGYLEQINLRWRVSRRWTIEISRGGETRLGVVYSRR